MKTNIIRLRPDRLNAPLVPCCVGKLSSAVFTISGDIPDDITGIAVHIDRRNDDGTITAYPAQATKKTDGTWHCYFSPFYFPAADDDLKYHIIGADTTNPSGAVPRWLGTGVLRVLDNPANGSTQAPEIIPADTYVRNPVTGLYHKLVAEVNEDGELSVAIDEEGISK